MEIVDSKKFLVGFCTFRFALNVGKGKYDLYKILYCFICLGHHSEGEVFFIFNTNDMDSVLWLGKVDVICCAYTELVTLPHQRP